MIIKSQANQFYLNDEVIMSIQNTTYDRRRFLRRDFNHELLVYNQEVFGQLLDISEEGLSFLYSQEQTKINDVIIQLNILYNERKIQISDLKCITVSDKRFRDDLIELKKIRRRSVRFDSLSAVQKKSLQQLIKETSSFRETEPGNDETLH